jgi:hypothetical protein
MGLATRHWLRAAGWLRGPSEHSYILESVVELSLSVSLSSCDSFCVVRVRVRFWSSVLERVRELKLSGKTCGLLEHVAQVVGL